MKRLCRMFVMVLVGLSAGISARAQSLELDGETLHWEVGAEAGLNTDGQEGGIRAIYFPTRYFGVKCTFGYATEIRPMEEWGESSLFDPYYVTRFKFNPSLVYRTPYLLRYGEDDLWGVTLFAEPGIVLSPGARGSRGARWFSKDLKAGVNLSAGPLVLSLGYGVSNFTLFSGNPLGLDEPRRNFEYLTHSVLAALAIKF